MNSHFPLRHLPSSSSSSYINSPPTSCSPPDDLLSWSTGNEEIRAVWWGEEPNFSCLTHFGRLYYFCSRIVVIVRGRTESVIISLRSLKLWVREGLMPLCTGIIIIRFCNSPLQSTDVRCCARGWAHIRTQGQFQLKIISCSSHVLMIWWMRKCFHSSSPSPLHNKPFRALRSFFFFFFFSFSVAIRLLASLQLHSLLHRLPRSENWRRSSQQ